MKIENEQTPSRRTNSNTDPFLPPTAFVLDPDNRVVMSVDRIGAYGRLSRGDVVKVVKS